MQEMLWGIWFAGLVLVVITRILINRYSDEYREEGFIYHTINILSCLCIVIVGGIADGKFIGMMLVDLPDQPLVFYIVVNILATLMAAFLTFIVGYAILGLYKLEDNIWLFIITFIVSVVIWSIPCTIYNSNVEVTEETVIVQKQQQELLSFCNVPVQKISGEVNGHSTIISGKVSGEVVTSDEISYWYLNENNIGLYECVPASSSRIMYIKGDEEPHVDIISYANQRISIDHNIGKETVSTLSEYKEYYFYIPQSVM